MTRDLHTHIGIVGAGFSGLGVAVKLKEAGYHDFLIAEQTGDVGGTWRDNTYPVVAVDITSFNYSFSWEQNPNWSRVYAPGRELKAYADHLVEKYGLREHLVFDTEITEARFDEDDHLWRFATADGREGSARFVVSAVGGLTQPKPPRIAGLDDFTGKTMHTARWDHDYDLTGKRVAVIGTGATSVQLVPAIADRVEHLAVFQRTPIWVVPKLDAPIPAPVRRVFDRVPGTQASVRLATGALTEAVMVLGSTYEPQFPLLRKGIEQLCRAHLRRQVADPVLRDKLTPRYDFLCKRPTFSNAYLRSFTRPDVDLITEPIERITATGIRTADGRTHEIDALILATGFKVFELGNTPPFPVHGTDGVELGKFWHDNRYQAYEGVTVPRFPNMFAILAPYSLTGPSYFSMIEASTTHTLRLLAEADRRGATYVEIREQPHREYFADILRRQRNTVFQAANCTGSNSYYSDHHGDTPMMRPATGPEMFWRARHFPLDHYRFDSLGRPDAGAPRHGGRRTA
ncbi:flavin-containing monooxygenase [Nocardia crassostreae]|uniref:flavin-containing monooxygenase n=1 Tax=Nocardia crassostreae TaxID=53428 RepID=UPI0008362E5E|nr:NAD(P)/FAD-dependent oxidoreductase [Nocardia crassostreae]